MRVDLPHLVFQLTHQYPPETASQTHLGQPKHSNQTPKHSGFPFSRRWTDSVPTEAMRINMSYLSQADTPSQPSHPLKGSQGPPPTPAKWSLDDTLRISAPSHTEGKKISFFSSPTRMQDCKFLEGRACTLLICLLL